MGAFYTKEEFITALKEAGLKQGDLVMAHVGMSSLRALPKGIKSQDEMSKLCADCLMEVVGKEGTLCVPSFTYSLGAGECYDAATTPTKGIGEFPEYFRKIQGMKRNNDPFLAISGIGPLTDELFEEHSNTSYGYGSFFDRFIQAGGKLVTIGVGIRWATIRYHIAEICHVPFRYIKFFSGERMVNGNRERCEWFYSVPPFTPEVEAISINMGFKIEEMLNNNPIMKRAPLGNGFISCIDGETFKQFITEQMSENPWLSGNGIDSREKIIELERLRTGEEQYDLNVSNTSLQEMAEKLAETPRYLMSDGYDASIKALSNRYGFNIHTYYTGERACDWIVPERWCGKGAYIEDMNGNTILSTDEGNLGMVAYSKSFEGDVSSDVLMSHLHSSVNMPELSLAYHREWGLCCREEDRERLQADKYHVIIKSDVSFDTMKVGEWCLRGGTDDEILIVSHLDGGKQFNYGLSGVLGGLEVFSSLKDRTLRHTLRLLITPNQIGLAAWLEANQTKNVSGIVTLDLLATANGEFTVVKDKGDKLWNNWECERILKQAGVSVQSLDYSLNPFDEDWMYQKEITDIPMIRLFVSEQYGSQNWPVKGFQTEQDRYNCDDIEHLTRYTDIIEKILGLL